MTNRGAWAWQGKRSLALTAHPATPSRFALWVALFFAYPAAIPLPAAAQAAPPPQEFTAVPLPVGSGARALGQGGAFTAVADDATAAVWNPAGLVQLERPEVSIVATHLVTTARFSDQTLTEGSGVITSFEFGTDEEESRSDVNFVSVTYPAIVGGRNVAFSLNYHQRYDFNQHLAYSKSSMAEEPGGLGSNSVTEHVHLSASGGIGSISPAVAVEILPRLSVGLSVNFLRNEFLGGDAYTQDLRFTHEQVDDFVFLPAPAVSSGRYHRHTAADFSGTNATLGAMWRAWQGGASRLTLASVVEIPYTADVDRSVRTDVSTTQFGNTVDAIPEVTKEHLAIDFPLSVTVGAALRLTDRTTVALDVAWTEWSDWMQENRDTGVRTRPLAGASESTEIDDLFAVRLGAEHVLSLPAGMIPLRAGLFYDPRPGLGNEQGIYGFSLGSGLTTPRFSLDAAYQYRTGDDLPGRNVSRELLDTRFDTEEHLFIASLIWYL